LWNNNITLVWRRRRWVLWRTHLAPISFDSFESHTFVFRY